MKYKSYESYKDSKKKYLKQIPSEWNILKVKHCFSIKNSKANQENPIVLSLARDGVKIRDITTGEGQLAESYYHYNPVKPNDLLLNPMDLLSGANCSLSEVEGVISPAYINLKFKEGINPKYYDYYFKLQYWSMSFFAHGKGVSKENRWTLNNETLINYYLPVPEKDTQDNIVQFLNKKIARINKNINKNKELISLLEEKKVALINQCVTKGLNPDVQMKDSGIEWIRQIPKHWKIVPLTKFLKSKVDYRGKTPEKVKEGVFLVTGKNIKHGKIDYNISQEFIKEEDYETVMRRGKPKIGDVLFTTEAPLGEVANVDYSKIALAQRIIKFSGKDNVLDNYYLKYYIMCQTFQNHLQSLATGSTALGIKGSKLFMLKLFLPPLTEQKEIISFLEKNNEHIDKIIRKVMNYNNLLEEYKTSLIHHAVTGKIDVREVEL